MPYWRSNWRAFCPLSVTNIGSICESVRRVRTACKVNVRRFGRMKMNWLRFVPAVAFAAIFALTAAHAGAADDETFSQNEIVQAASDFFGTTTAAVAKAVERVFAEQGLPDAYIKGQEGSGRSEERRVRKECRAGQS